MKIYNEHKRRGRIWRAVEGQIGFYVVECRKCVKEMGADVYRAGGVEMVGIYFSGTGNTKYCVERFLACCDGEQEAVSIEDSWAVEAIRENEVIVFGYPVYFSNMPKIVRDFLEEHQACFCGKKIFLIATMGLFSGDGTGCSARLFKKYGADIVGGVHLKMPDCIGDERALKRTVRQNHELIEAAGDKIRKAAEGLKGNRPPREGLGFWYHAAGLFGQRLWFYGKTKDYTDRVHVDADKCIGCGKCVSLCPMDNMELRSGKAVQGGRCTMCYRCVNHCPGQAITLLGKKLYEQCTVEKYL